MLRGDVNGLGSDGIVRGWAHNPVVPGRPVSVKIQCGRAYAVVSCDLFRADVEAHFRGFGQSGFEFDVRNIAGGSEKLSVSFADNGDILPNGEIVIPSNIRYRLVKEKLEISKEEGIKRALICYVNCSMGGIGSVIRDRIRNLINLGY